MTKKKDVFFGRQPALEILNSGRTIEKVILQKDLVGAELAEIRAICTEKEIPLQFVPKEKINYLLFPMFHNKNVNHQGVVGFYGTIEYLKLDDVLHQVLSKGEHALILLLDGITDIRNIGAIARTAACMGAHAIVVPQKGSASINAEAVKASAGALNSFPVCRERDLRGTIDYLRLNGIAVLGSSLQAKKPLNEMNFDRPVAIVIGSEGEGMSYQVQKLCDDLFTIPMSGDLDSLNASVSCGMMLYEASEQRNQ